MSRFFKYVVLTILSSLLVLTALLLLLRIFGPSYLIPYIVETVENETNGRYTLTVNSDSLKIRFVSMTVRLGETEFVRDSVVDAYADLPFLNQFDVHAKLQSFNIHAFNLLRYAFTDRWVVDEINLVRPEIIIRKNRFYNPNLEINLADAELDSIPLFIGDSLRADTLAWKEFQASGKSILPHILVEQFLIENGSFSFYGGRSSKPLREGNGISLKVSDFEILEDKQLEVGDLELKIEEASTLVSKNLARLTIRRMELHPTSFHLDSLHFGHIVDKYQINEIRGFRASWLQLGANNIDIDGFSPEHYVNDSTITIDRITIGNVHLNLFKDKGEPNINPAYKPLPAEQIRSISSKLLIDTVEIVNADLVIDMQAPAAIKPGQITLSNTKVLVDNITNIPEALENEPQMKVDVSTRVMDKIPLSARYEFDLSSLDDEYAVYCKTQPFDPKVFNDFLGSQFFVVFKSGFVNNLEFSYMGSKLANVGEIDFEYTNLKVEKLKGYQEYLEGRPKTGFLTTMGNFLISQNRSKSGKNYKAGVIYYEKEYNRDVIHGTVMSVLSGVMSSLGFTSKNLERQLKRAESLDGSTIQKSAETAIKKSERAESKKEQVKAKGAKKEEKRIN